MSSRTTRLASGLTWTLVTKFAIVKPRAAAAAGDGTTASRTASATSARAIPSAPERDAGRLRGDRGAARAGHGIERGPLVGGVALHRLDEVRHEVGAPLELDVDVRPRLVGPHAQADELVVAGNDQHHEPGDYEDEDDPADGHGRPPALS